jgi:VIT1/CCC1 family predicted Fe2+/Mn2+ transporter
MLKHSEFHRSHRIGWLRAAVLGANDGIVSTASLIIGIAAAHAPYATIVLSGAAGLVSGAMAMAAGEYVSVCSQSDTENADLAKERSELETEPEHELQELTGIYVSRGLSMELAHQVALQLTAHDALGAHARDELGITEIVTSRPVQAALASACTFAVGAALPLIVTLIAPTTQLIPIVATMSLAFLAALGALSAKAGGANIWRGTARVAFWGALAMAATAAVGALFGVVAA